MTTFNTTRLRQLLLFALLFSGLVACSASSSLSKKNTPSENLSVSSVDVPEKIELAKKSAAEVERLTISAEGALGTGDLDTAEQTFQELEKLNPGNLRAAEGLRKVEARRRHISAMEEIKSLLEKNNAQNDQLALAKLREILVENPDNNEARTLYKSLVAKQDSKRAESLRKRLKYKTPISLQFRDVSLKVLIEALAKGTKVNFILDQEISNEQKVTLFVNQVSLEDALDLLVQTNQLRKKYWTTTQ